MIQYRGSVFETNSSSAHSLVILDKPFDYYTPEEAQKELWVYYDEDTGIYNPQEDLYFGRYPFRILRTFEDKLNYAYANAPHRLIIDKKNHKSRWSTEYWRISRVVKNIIPGFKKAIFESFYDKPSKDQGMLWPWLKQHGITMEQFLLDKTIIVICDGDEYHAWKHMKEDGLINLGIIKKEIGIND